MSVNIGCLNTQQCARHEEVTIYIKQIYKTKISKMCLVHSQTKSLPQTVGYTPVLASHDIAYSINTETVGSFQSIKNQPNGETETEEAQPRTRQSFAEILSIKTFHHPHLAFVPPTHATGLI